jgi:hypothetical protein
VMINKLLCLWRRPALPTWHICEFNIAIRPFSSCWQILIQQYDGPRVTS